MYSQLKPAWHLDRIQTMRSGLLPVPVHVQLVLSDLCNQACSFCAYRMPSGLSNELFPEGGEVNPNRRIATDKAIEIIGDCAALGVRAIQFTGGGEPTVHKDHLQLFATAQGYGMKTALVTNGVRLDTEHAAVKAMTWVRVSIDAGNPDTYTRTRRVPAAHWHAAWRSVRALVESCDGAVSVGFVVTPDNYCEIAEAAAHARDCGASALRVGAVFSTEGPGYYGDSFSAIRAEIDKAKGLQRDGFDVVDLFDRRMDDMVPPDEPICGYQHLTTYIGGDLGVYRCCNTAYTQVGKVADLHEMRFRDVFASQPLPAFDARTCRMCQFRGQNKVIAALLREPTHAEFV